MARKSGGKVLISAGDIMARVFKAFANAVYDAGGDDNDVRRIENDAKLKRVIGKLVVGERKESFPIWKTLEFGTGFQTVDIFRRALESTGCRIGDWANDILDRARFANTVGELDLVVVSVSELGFPNGATRKEIYQKAQELGLELCPPEVGPQLRLQYLDQPMNEWLFIGMEPITDSDGNLEVFSVERSESGRWLFGDYGYPVSFWYGDYRWVFIRRK